MGQLCFKTNFFFMGQLCFKTNFLFMGQYNITVPYLCSRTEVPFNFHTQWAHASPPKCIFDCVCGSVGLCMPACLSVSTRVCTGHWASSVVLARPQSQLHAISSSGRLQSTTSSSSSSLSVPKNMTCSMMTCEINDLEIDWSLCSALM